MNLLGFNEGADAEDIRTLEKKIGKIPDDFKDYIMITNGQNDRGLKWLPKMMTMLKTDQIRLTGNMIIFAEQKHNEFPHYLGFLIDEETQQISPEIYLIHSNDQPIVVAKSYIDYLEKYVRLLEEGLVILFRHQSCNEYCLQTLDGQDVVDAFVNYKHYSMICSQT